MRVTDTKTLASALIDICEYDDVLDDVDKMKLLEASERINDLAALASEMSGMLDHDMVRPDGCKACAMQKRLAELWVVA